MKTHKYDMSSENVLLLLEKQDYMALFQPLLKVLPDDDKGSDKYGLGTMPTSTRELYIENITKVINDARRILKRYDRIIWYLRFYRLSIIKNNPDFFENISQAYFEEYSKRAGNVPIKQLISDAQMFNGNTILSVLQHFLSLQDHVIESYRFGWQLPNDILRTFGQMEEDWKERRGSRHVPMKDSDARVVLQFPDGMVWVLLNRESCKIEGNAMGHCGNAGARVGDRLLSLRRPNPDKTTWTPFLTFILDRNGLLGEMKGRGNDKPAARYHPYIVDLLKQPFVKGIKGGGYEPENNFSIDDLPKDLRDRLYKAKPELMTPKDYYARIGFDDVLKQKIMAFVQGTYDGGNIHIMADGRHGKEKWIGEALVIRDPCSLSDVMDRISRTSHEDSKEALDIIKFDRDPAEDVDVDRSTLKEVFMALPPSIIKSIGGAMSHEIDIEERPELRDALNLTDPEDIFEAIYIFEAGEDYDACLAEGVRKATGKKYRADLHKAVYAALTEGDQRFVRFTNVDPKNDFEGMTALADASVLATLNEADWNEIAYKGWFEPIPVRLPTLGDFDVPVAVAETLRALVRAGFLKRVHAERLIKTIEQPEASPPGSPI